MRAWTDRTEPGRSTPAMHAMRGFSLIEVAVVIFIITLLLGSILVPLTTQVEQRQVSDTQKALDEIKEALLGFAVARGYLPCPDVTSGAGANDGVEDVGAGGTCTSATGEGNLPWVTLGAGPSDAWGNRYHYEVVPAFAQRSPAATFTLSSASNLRVCSNISCAGSTQLTSSTAGEGAVAVILSYGRNGYGAINSLTGSANPAPTIVDEIDNIDGGTRYISRTQTAAGSAAGEFDDVVTWIGKYGLFNRMVAASKLP